MSDLIKNCVFLLHHTFTSDLFVFMKEFSHKINVYILVLGIDIFIFKCILLFNTLIAIVLMCYSHENVNIRHAHSLNLVQS